VGRAIRAGNFADTSPRELGAARRQEIDQRTVKIKIDREFLARC